MRPNGPDGPIGVSWVRPFVPEWRTSHWGLVKWVFYQLGGEAAVWLECQAYHRVPNAASPAGQRAIFGCRRHQCATFTRSNCFERCAERIVCPRLDLDYHQVVAATAYQVQLAPSG